MIAIFCLTGCEYMYSEPTSVIENTINSAIGTTTDDTASEKNDIIEDNSEDSEALLGDTEELDQLDSLIPDEELVPFNEEEPFSYCEQPTCTYNKSTKQIDFTLHFDKVPQSDNAYIYLFEIGTYEGDNSFDGKHYLVSALKDYDVTLSFPYYVNRLFSRYVPVISYNNEFYPIALGQYITNPEDIAEFETPYPIIESKKGILLDPMTIDKEELNSLNVKRVVYNIPLSFIMGETDSEKYPTYEYEYRGKIYNFNSYMISGFDNLFTNLTNNGYHITGIVLNDWNTDYPEIIHPLSRKKTYRSEYYAFNTEDKDGVRAMEAAALFLSERYSSGAYGIINDWVIANEINQQKVWNYMATEDIDYYTESFEKSFRTFYNAIKSNNVNANVYFSIDQDWNCNRGLNYMYFNGKDILEKFNELAKSRGNYDWALSIHPYPYPLTRTIFWHGVYDKTEDARRVTPMNLSVVTDFMNKEEFLNTKGDVRPIGVTELGFSSKSGEKMQAAAFAYCYYIIENNEFINSFLMNRQTDSYASLQSGLALGIYNPDYSAKYISDIFSKIDTDEGKKYLQEMLEILGESSLEDALLRAK